MKYCSLFGLICLLPLCQSFVPSVLGQDASVNWVQTRAVPAAEAVQAAAADDKYFYAVTNKQIAKYDRASGDRVAVSSGDALHLNSGFMWRGKLYCAHSNYPNQPECSEIKVLDPESMQLVTFKNFGNFGGSLTWAIRHEDAWWCNFARYGDDNAKTFLVKFDDQWREQASWTYPGEVIREIGGYSLSGGIWQNGSLLVTDHDHPVLYRLALPTEGSVLKFGGKESAPFTGQGIASDPQTGGLVGINRAKRQVVFAVKQLDAFVTDVLQPFWRARQISEPVFFIQADEKARSQATLLFQPDKISSVMSATRETVFESGRDYVLDAETATIRLPEGSRIPVTTTEQLYPLMTSDLPKIARQQGDKTRGIFFDNGAGYHNLQVEVTYEFAAGQWKGEVPKYAGNQLPHTMKKLRDKEPVKILLSGDSISEGYNATKFTKAKPGCPAYGELVALVVEKHFGSKVSYKNYAVAGWSAGRGLQQVIDEKVGEQKPDLVIIAYGMNDVFAHDAAIYQKNIQGIIDTIRQESPDTEFILVATMLGNVEWGMPMEQFPLYRDALKKLCGPGVVLADLTSVWEEFLKRKSFYDLTGNGVNHPNDFGHRVYAQTILALLIEAGE